MSISLNEYETICNLAVRMAKVTTRENIIYGDTWKPFTLLYDQMVRRKEIEPLSSLTRDKRLKYWNQTEGSKIKRIWISQALYVYELITKP